MPGGLRLLVITDPRYLEHQTGSDHPESPARLEAVLRGLAAAPLASRLTSGRSRAATWEEVAACHDEAYLYRFEEAALAGRSFLDHPDNGLCPESYGVALLAAGAGLAAVDALEAGRAGHVFCPVRPPGHHAERNMALGFCFLNNAAITARYWQRRYGRRRLCIIDWDAHHGNGIQAAFEEDPEVFYISIHEHPTFSFPSTGYADERGSGAGFGATLNIPLPPGADDLQVLAACEAQIAPALAAFRPEGLIVAAGFDGHRLDDMSGLAYSTDLFRQLGRLTAAWSSRHCPGRALSLLEGGYHLEALADGVAAYLEGLLETGPPPELEQVS